MDKYLSEAIASILPAEMRASGSFTSYELAGLDIVRVVYTPTHVSHRMHTWGTGECITGGYETRTVLGTVTQDVADQVRQLAARLAKTAADTEAAKTAAADARAAWIASLPDRLDGDTRIDKGGGCLTDNYGNHLCGLPKKPVANLAAWAADQLADFSGD